MSYIFSIGVDSQKPYFMHAMYTTKYPSLLQPYHILEKSNVPKKSNIKIEIIIVIRNILLIGFI